MSLQNVFAPNNESLVPQGDISREAIDSLRGYAYQVTAAALAWLDLLPDSRLFLEVAEDYAVVANKAFKAVQVKDTVKSGVVTLNTESVQKAIADFVFLTTKNPKADVQFRYFTTSEIGTEKTLSDRPGGIAGLKYWRKAAAGDDVSPIRSILESDKFSGAVREFVRARDDADLRNDMLQKIHWDCGQPNLASLRKEFIERLVVVGRDIFRLPAPESTRIADVLIYQVLEKCIANSSTDRVLTRADLYNSIDQATRVFVPRSTADMMQLVSSGLMASMLTAFGPGLALTPTTPGWLIEGKSIPSRTRMLQRPRLEEQILDRMRRFGVGVIVGASGLGKSSIARAVANRIANTYATIDFRNANAEETRNRLDLLISKIGDIHGTTFIFDDLNHLNEPLVGGALWRMFDALRRRDRVAVVTCYLKPTARALSETDLNVECVVECPYFSEEETGKLVALYGGEVTPWAKIAHVSGAFGHPQLVHAFITGISARGWSSSELVDFVNRGFSSDEIEAERETARRNLISALPQNARALLYRLSLTIGRFNRQLALTVANVRPVIKQAGECLDVLVGPWLESTGRDSYRVSPLASRSGYEMLSNSEQLSIHSVIASSLTVGKKIDGANADIIVAHAMMGKNNSVLFKIANSILAADQNTSALLAENLTMFRLLRTDQPIYPDNIAVSGTLRLAQFKIAVAANDADMISACATALFSEGRNEADENVRKSFRAISFALVLGTLGIANYVDNWFKLLEEFRAFSENDELLGRLAVDFDDGNPLGVNIFGALYAIGSANLSSVKKLEKLLQELAYLQTDTRSLYLEGISVAVPDYSAFINMPWVTEHRREGFDATEATERYRKMARTTQSWGVRPLTLQCWVACAVILDEICKDGKRALKTLDEAVEVLGDDVILSRARAKIYWRAQDHNKALLVLREIADEVGSNNPVERAFALREAAISAAKCGEWEQAEQWFLEGKKAAELVGFLDMELMAVCLGVDAAVAAIKTNGFERGLRGLGEALMRLSGFDPASSITTKCRHQLVRHTVLWVKSYIEKSNVIIDGEQIAIAPGCCSNPDPMLALAERPLGSLDVTWYMLADAEVSSGANVGIADNLSERISGKPIPIMEVSLRERKLIRLITSLDATSFARELWDYVEAVLHIRRNRERMMMNLDMSKPIREDISRISFNETDPLISQLFRMTLLVYVISAICKKAGNTLRELQSALKERYGESIIDNLLARAVTQERVPSAISFEEALVDEARQLTNELHPIPRAYCSSAIRFFQFAQQSTFRDFLIPLIAEWQRNEWSRIIASETFRLQQPRIAVPIIIAVLNIPSNSVQFLGALFLATSRATGLSLPNEIEKEFFDLASKPESE